MTLVKELTNIADTIRSIKNTADKYSIDDMISEISNMEIGNNNVIVEPSDGTPLCQKITKINLKTVDFSNITSFDYLFHECKSLTDLFFPEDFGKGVSSMSHMFDTCSSLKALDLSTLDTSEVTNMSYMFRQLTLPELDVTSLNTNLVSNMSYMFSESKYKNILFPENFGSNATDMSYMFSQCFDLATLDLSNFKTEIVTNMSNMFMTCESLTSLDLSSFNTQSVTSMDSMFYNCSSLTNLILGDNWAVNTAITEVNLSDCPLTKNSIVEGVFNKLAARTDNPTLVINEKTRKETTKDDLVIARNKGWFIDNLQKINQDILIGSNYCFVVYGNDKFIATDDTTLAYSKDGFNWTEVKQNVIDKPNSVYYVGNMFFLSNDSALAYSTNGIDWELCSLPDVTGSPSSSLSMSYGNGVFVMAYYTTTGKGILFYSNNGIEWYSGTVTSSMSDKDSFLSVAFGNNMFLATSLGGFIVKSTDGTTWNEVANVTNTSMYAVTSLYGKDKFILFGAISSSNNGYKIMYSTDGVTLTETQALQKDTVISGIYANDMFIAGSTGNYSLICSEDGITWKEIDQKTIESVFSITYGNGMFVLGGRDENEKSTLAYYT